MSYYPPDDEVRRAVALMRELGVTRLADLELGPEPRPTGFDGDSRGAEDAVRDASDRALVYDVDPTEGAG